MPRARSSGGYISPAAARASWTVPFATPTSAKPTRTSATELHRVPRPVTTVPIPPMTKPAASTGTRPRRSIARPATSAPTALDERTTAGPSPSRPSMPVTATNVTVATAAVSCDIPNRHARPAESSAVLRPTFIRRTLARRADRP
jgi:hypothetical protein